jgi:hypothetical protein
MASSTSSGMCSTPTARPSGPTISAMQTVRYPLPLPTSRAKLKGESEDKQVSSVLSVTTFYWSKDLKDTYV